MAEEHKEVKKTLARNIKKYRERADITQEKAAERADITLKYWQRLEMESQTDLPSLPTLFKIAKAVETSASALLSQK